MPNDNTTTDEKPDYERTFLHLRQRTEQVIKELKALPADAPADQRDRLIDEISTRECEETMAWCLRSELRDGLDRLAKRYRKVGQNQLDSECEGVAEVLECLWEMTECIDARITVTPIECAWRGRYYRSFIVGRATDTDVTDSIKKRRVVQGRPAKRGKRGKRAA